MNVKQNKTIEYKAMEYSAMQCQVNSSEWQQGRYEI